MTTAHDLWKTSEPEIEFAWVQCPICNSQHRGEDHRVLCCDCWKAGGWQCDDCFGWFLPKDEGYPRRLELDPLLCIDCVRRDLDENWWAHVKPRNHVPQGAGKTNSPTGAEKEDGSI